ncbi:MAG: DotA/TraY family protein [Desulfurivibrionaceae bacterium]
MKLSSKALFSLIILLQPGSAQATISEYLSAADGDPTFEMLGNLFGPVPGIIPGTPSPLSEMFVIFNMAVFSVAVLMVLYGVISGVMHTAVEGEFLGKRHSSIWYPIRVVYGIFGLVPIFAGWSFPQALMILGMVVGIGIGNITWDAGWKFMLGHVESAVLVTPEAASRDDSLEALVAAQICSISHNYQQKEDEKQAGKTPILFPEEGTLVKQGNISKLVFGSAEGGYFQDSCGGIQVYPKSQAPGILDGPKGMAALPPFDHKAVAEAQAEALVAMSASLHSHSKSLALEGLAPDPAALADIKNQYTKQISVALAKASMESRHGFSEFMKKEGSSWLYAGAIFLKIASVNREIMDAASAEILPLSPREGSVVEQGIVQAGGIVKGWLESVKNLVTFDFAKVFGDSMESAGVRAAMNLMTGGEEDLMTGITRLGYSLTGAGAIGLGVAGGLAAVGGGDVLQALGLPALFKILLIIGLAMAYLLPFLPFILWFGEVISYFIVLVEAVVGAPLWMLAHLETEGEGMGQRTAHGYMFLLNVIFRPVLMIFGLVGGWLLVNLLGEILKYSLSVLYGSSAFAFSGWASIGAFFMTLIIFCYLSYLLISRGFSLIHHLPNEVLSWVGGHVGKVGGGEDERTINALYNGGQQMGHGMGAGGVGQAKNAIKAAGGDTIKPGK